ncbi:uncharacterized protein LOC119459431 [Dermacentor silvarum]|uniref:uncharacterized protein LOC119459431 n=1 Tax=Dermacentor silvarum TaxID=543639 RepID=UPI0021016559|nr:uncharacterized protein LOC119459431 [Dermacentor silvarum]
MQAGDSKRTVSGTENDSYKIPAAGGWSAICSGTEADSSVGVDTVAPEPSARSSKEITPMEFTPYEDNRPADERCERAAELRPCSPRDMTFTVHFSVRPGRVGSCVTLSANVSRCLRGANRFWTLRDCEAACNHTLSVAPLKTSSNNAATSTTTMTTTTHRRRRRRCDAAVSFGPCSVADRRRSSANFVFEHGRCVALRAGSCADAGFSTLRHCRSACPEKDPLQIDELVNSTLA